MNNLHRLLALVLIATAVALGIAAAQTPTSASLEPAYSPQYGSPTKMSPQYQAFLEKGVPLSASDVTAINTWISTRIAGMKTPYCWRQSSTRGVGVPLSTCPAGTEKNGLLCYPTCKANYWGNGPVCWQSCPAGYIDTGAFCHIDKPLTKGGTWRCTERDWFGTCWWKVLDCPTGYVSIGIGCALKTPSVPTGYSGASGLDLTKGSYGRGAGKPMVCAAGMEEDAGLCYTPCKSGYHGVGPVCWQNCPPGLTPCGAGCANSGLSCGTNTFSMVMGPVTIAANIATAGTFGSGAQAAEAGATDAVSSAASLAKLTDSPAKTMAMKAVTCLSTRNLVTGAYEIGNLSNLVKTGTAMIGQTAAFKTELSDAVKVSQWADYLGYAIAHFDLVTTPEAAAAVDKAFAGKPYAAAWVKAQYTVMVGETFAKEDAIQHGITTAKAIASFDPSGVMATIAAFSNPQCYSNNPFPTVTVLHD